MGSFFDIGYKPDKHNGSPTGLTVGLNRTASNALEALFEESLLEMYPEIHEKIMMYLPLDQISFNELNKEEFNMAIDEIQKCLRCRTEPAEWQSYQKFIWEAEIEPLVQQDERYQGS